LTKRQKRSSSKQRTALIYELKEGNLEGRLYADSVASVLAMQLARRYSCLKDVRISKGGMAPHKLRRAIEFISNRLEQESLYHLLPPVGGDDAHIFPAEG
jgi:hypothetical protein